MFPGRFDSFVLKVTTGEALASLAVFVEEYFSHGGDQIFSMAYDLWHDNERCFGDPAMWPDWLLAVWSVKKFTPNSGRADHVSEVTTEHGNLVNVSYRRLQNTSFLSEEKGYVQVKEMFGKGEWTERETFDAATLITAERSQILGTTVTGFLTRIRQSLNGEDNDFLHLWDEALKSARTGEWEQRASEF